MNDNNNKEENSCLSPRTLALAVASIGLGAFVVWLVIFAILGGETTTRTAMLLQLSQVLAQVVLVTLLGTTLTFIYNLYAKDQEQRRLQLQKEEEQRRLQIDEDNSLRRELLGSVIAVRAQVEKARRDKGTGGWLWPLQVPYSVSSLSCLRDSTLSAGGRVRVDISENCRAPLAPREARRTVMREVLLPQASHPCM